MNAAPVANHILWLANKENKPITPMKMQKLLFFLHGWYLAVTGRPLIDEEHFSAWQYGPVIPSVYSSLRQYGAQPIGDYIKQWNPSTFDWEPLFVNTQLVPQFDQVLQHVWGKYSHFNGIDLSSMTHQPNSPWSLTPANNDIDNELIRNYFVDLANNRLANQYNA